MDFKVAGDDNGVTAFQMDIKVEGAFFCAVLVHSNTILPFFLGGA